MLRRCKSLYKEIIIQRFVFECCAVLLLGCFFPWKEKLEIVVECLPMSTSKSSGRMVDKLDLRTWFLNLRALTLGFSFEVFKTTCMDEEAPLREAAFPSREYRFPLWEIREISVIGRALRSITEKRNH